MALPPDFVDGLYRTVLTAVKASNGVPSEEEDFHFQYKFNQDFHRGADDVAGRVTSLLQRIRHANVHTKNDDDVVDFDPLEENGPLTDLVDSLLERASEQIIRFQKGEVDLTPAASSAPASTPTNTTPSTRQVSARPQDSFEDKIDNSEAPFVSKLRTKVHAGTDATSTDDEEVYHPYRYEIANLKYQPWQLQPTEKIPSMIPLDDAIYTYVDTVEALEAMMATLKEANLIAIDLENHSYHSFQGFLCLMQISTWTHDWLVDTLALRSHLHELNSIFCDPTKLKVLHGADSDIVWLQRDLGLYIVNMFDTGQAARCLEYARFSLAYLLLKHCNITADKQYQLADWRLRPLDDAMIKYAREDTRYLLYIYEVMKAELLQRDASASGHNLLFTTLSRSQALCLSVYEKPKAPTSDDAANVVFKLKSTVGLETVDDGHVNLMEQLMLWRDRLARRVDESTGYVCPNAVLMKILNGLPTTPAALFQLCHPIPPLVRKYAHELTLLLTRQASDDGKNSVNTEEASVPRVEKTIVVSKTKDSSQLDEFKGWQAPATSRKPKEATVGAAEGLFEQFGAKDHDTIDLLNQVRERFASRVFVIVELAGKENTPAVAPQATPRVPAPVKEELKQETPLSLTEKYPKLKKRKAETPATTATEPSADGRNAATSDFKPFDYAPHASAVSTLDLDQQKAPVERTKRKKGYNPFVAAPDDSASGSVNQKRGYNAPRSSMFR